MFQNIKPFVTSESGATAVEWTSLVAAIVGFGMASVAAVQTGVISLGGKSSTSLEGAVIEYSSAIAAGGPDVQMNTGWNYVYTPLSTKKEEYAAFMYELAGMSETQLRTVYISYLEEADRLIQLGDLEGAAKHLDVAGAAAAVMKDFKYPLPDGEKKLNQYYGQLRTTDDKAQDDKMADGTQMTMK